MLQGLKGIFSCALYTRDARKELCTCVQFIGMHFLSCALRVHRTPKLHARNYIYAYLAIM